MLKIEGKAAQFLAVNDEKPYHCSAVYAAALHAVTRPFLIEQLGPTADSREISGSMDVNGLVQMLTSQARENMVAIMDVAMPAPSLTGNCFSPVGHSISRHKLC